MLSWIKLEVAFEINLLAALTSSSQSRLMRSNCYHLLLVSITLTEIILTRKRKMFLWIPVFVLVWSTIGVNATDNHQLENRGNPQLRVPQDKESLKIFMDRRVKTVPKLWKEWHEGINGRPPMKWASRSRATLGVHYEAEEKFCHRRRVVLKYIEWIRERYQLPISAAIEMVEDERIENNLQLNSFSSYCSKKMQMEGNSKTLSRTANQIQIQSRSGTVPQLWIEWHYGQYGFQSLSSKYASMKVMNAYNEQTTKFLQNRYHIIVYIEWLQEKNKHLDLNTIISLVENDRVELGLTLDEMGGLVNN